MIFYHFFSNPWVVFALKLAAVFIFFLTAPLVLGYVEHKGLAHMQSRPPLECGDAAPLSDRPAFPNNPEDSTLAREYELKRMLF